MSDRIFAMSLFDKWKGTLEDTKPFLYFVFRGVDGQTKLDCLCFVAAVSETKLELTLPKDPLLRIVLTLDKARFKCGDSREDTEFATRELEPHKFSEFVSIKLLTGGDCFLAVCHW